MYACMDTGVNVCVHMCSLYIIILICVTFVYLTSYIMVSY